MSSDYEFSGDENPTGSDSSDVKKNQMYRLELDGILVYDSYARISDEPISQAQRIQPKLIQRVKKNKPKDLDYGSCYIDLMQYLSIPNYTAMKEFPQDYTLAIPSNTLRFSSKFESGNLRKAIRINENEYRLLLEYDTDTLGYIQWYFFSVKPYKNQHKVRFNITNLLKYDSLYNQGMKPVVFSEKEHMYNPSAWHRDCTEVSYFKNSTTRPDSSKKYYTLTFSYTFEDPTDTIFFAYSYPYTYSQLVHYINSLKIMHSQVLSSNTLCHTLAGNACPVLTITQDLFSYNTWPEEQKKLGKSAAGRKILRIRESKQMDSDKNKHRKKKGIFITARVHPGESNSSYMVKGLIDFLVGNSKEANMLRKKFIFKIVPMLNPDGVVYGNYRCSLLGVDLNRRWTKPNKLLHPTIYYAKKLLQAFTEENEVLMFCDLHGHSIKKEAFMYGCCSSGNGVSDIQTNVFTRLIPFLFSQRTELFSLPDSKFRVEKSKTSTGRVVNFTELGILSSYTLEASFYGSSRLGTGDSHFSTWQLESLGKDLCCALSTFLYPREFRKKLSELTGILTGRNVEYKRKGSEDEDEEISIRDAIKEIDERAVEDLNLNDEDSGGSDTDGSENDEKKSKFRKGLEKSVESQKREVKANRFGFNAHIEGIREARTPVCIRPPRAAKESVMRSPKIKENRSSSVLKEKKTSCINTSSKEFMEHFRIKSILNPSPIVFTREKVPNDCSLLNLSKKLIAKKQTKKYDFNNKKRRLQIIDVIKFKLESLL